jgi:hypothetical protein
MTRRLAAAPSSGPAWEPFLMWRILTASLGVGRVSGHRMIGVIPDGDQRPGQQEVSVPGAECVAPLPGTPHVPFTVAGAGIGWFVRWHLTACGVMLAGQGRLAPGSMQACHEVISGGEGLVQQWRVTQLTRLGSPGRWRRPRPITSAGIRSPCWPSAAVPRHWPCA